MTSLFTVKQPAEYMETIQRSKFIGHIYPVKEHEKARELISSACSKYRDASHICWAYAIGMYDITYHSSDAGEPSGTAGKPIERVIQQHNLTNVLLTVTRYYGGVQLGIRGIIDAYTHIAQETVNKAQLQQSVMKDFYELELSYKRLEKLKSYIRDKDADIIDINYGKEISLTISIRNTYNFKEFLDAEKSSGELTYEFLKSDVFI